MQPRIALLIAIVGTLAIASVASAQPSPWSQLGYAYRPAAADEDVVARVDGRAISRAELRINHALLQFNNSVSPNKVGADLPSALAPLIETRALGAEAERRGLTLSDEEVSAYISQVRGAFQQGGTARNRLAEFLSGVGHTEDAFFASAFARSHYAEAAAIGRLRAQVVVGLSMDAGNAAWGAFAVRVKNAASVQILDSSLR